MIQRPFAVFAAVAFVLSSACGGCDGTTSSNNANNPPNNEVSNNASGSNNETNGSNNFVWPDGCVDEDDDGFPTGLTCSGRVDCDDTDPDVRPGVAEVCFDEIDNDCDDGVDEGCPDCVEGDTRSCGTDEGECVAGTQTCRDEVWSDCEGSVGPEQEVCNGVDDNCDGDVDENPRLLCDDGQMCNGVETCEAGACTTGDAVDCSALDGPCLVGECSEKDGGCRAFPVENGTACDDGLFCTEGGVCDAGECVTTPRDCSSEDDQCNAGVCDDDIDQCVKEPRSDGTTCDDGLFCTTTDSCTAGICGGATRDCSSAADQCNEGVCDESADACVKQAVTNGTTCEDGLYCTVSDSCQAGVCQGGGQRQCGAAGGSCRDGVCDEATRSCSGNPVPDGTTCDDGAFCTVNDVCSAGNCVGGGPRSCAGVATDCKVGSCNENLNLCVPLPAPDGTICDDGAFCTVNDACSAGTCSGTMRSCANVADACNDGICDETADACQRRAKSDGTSCADNLFCTVNEVCVAGQCTRSNRDCSGSGDECNDGVCDETADACTALPAPDGTACSDGLFCTSGDSCQAGTCQGGPTNCSNAGDACQDGVCDEAAGSCTGTAKPDGTSCNDNRNCTANDECQAGTCTGAPLDCTAFGDGCNNGRCNEMDGCYAAPKPDNTVCSDGSLCTENDLCSGGNCAGTPVDCDPFTDQCNDAECVEGMGCQLVPLSGNPCTDTSFCTVNETCNAGACEGDQRTCTPTVNDGCFDGVCDESQDSCVDVNNGTCDVCDGGTPTANAGGDQIVTPNTTVQLNGTGSTDPTNQTLTYSWTISSAPSGSRSRLSSSTSATPTLLADVSGTFVVCLTVTDSPDLCQSSQDCMTIEVIPDDVDLHIELVWDTDRSDLDLHYQAPPYAQTDWFRALRNNGLPASCGRTGPQASKGPSVFWCLKSPDWGGTPELWQPDGVATNDPSLDVDNVTGFGPENINQETLFDGGPFTIGVHHYADFVNSSDPSAGSVLARIRVYVGGSLVRETQRSLGCKEFWEAAEVNVSGGGTNVAVTLKSKVFDTPDQGICRCSRDSDCFSGESCLNTSIGMVCL